MEDKYIGTAPFCKGTSNQCKLTPGYVYGGKDDCGDGSCCWTGSKVKCEFNDKAWRESATYSEFTAEDPKAINIKPQFVWMGKGPACSVNPCTLFKSGFFPIRNDNCGDGSCCVTGEKWLGIKPILSRHKQIVDQGRKDCQEMGIKREEKLTAGFKATSDVVKFAGKFFGIP
jgi:hypothetical protein